MHERVLVHLQARTGFANSRAQGLDVLHGKTAVVHDPHGGNAIEIFLDLDQRLLVLHVGHVVHLLLFKLGFRPSRVGIVA